MFDIFKKLINTMFNSTFRTLGRILGYLLFGLLFMFIYNSFFKAETINILDTPLSGYHLDYFGRVLENSKYLNKDYIAFSHDCNDNSICSTLLIGDLQSGSSKNDHEIINLDVLPEASEDTLNKVYLVNGNYYITDKQEANFTPIPLNENLNGNTIYFKDISYLMDSFDFTSNNRLNYASSSVGYHAFSFSRYSFDFFNVYSLCGVKPNGKDSVIFEYYSNTYDSKYISSFYVDVDCSINNWMSQDIFDFSQYFSLTPFETSYTWHEFDFTSLYDYICTDCEFFTLGENNYYKTGIYDTVNLKGNLVYSNKSDVSLERSTIYEKIIALSLLLIICFSICYKLIFNK